MKWYWSGLTDEARKKVTEEIDELNKQKKSYYPVLLVVIFGLNSPLPGDDRQTKEDGYWEYRADVSLLAVHKDHPTDYTSYRFEYAEKLG